ncbi:tRNA pseudouridine synthase [Chloropicon primus]|nr:tRNA pseudouridine synthase [Chloropicon primus]
MTNASNDEENRNRMAKSVADADADAVDDAKVLRSNGGGAKKAMKEGTREWENRPRKRNVAFFYGYVGTGYLGSMINEDTAQGQTLEYVLFKGLHDMGGVLPTNFPDQKKVRVNRASRTDKGVHALANVMTLKLECPYNYWIDGKCGKELVEKVNDELPRKLRVFSVTPVTKGFAPRAFCNKRTYQFYIPAPVLGIAIDENGECVSPAEVEKSLTDFNSNVLPLFCGFKPYHNFTERRLYTKKHRDKLKKRLYEKHDKVKRDRSAEGGGAAAEGGAEREERGEEPSTVGKEGGDSAEREVEVEKFCDNVRWFHTFNRKTKLDRSHYRHMHEVSCGARLTNLGKSDGEKRLALRVTIQGESFMYHQIRHMVGLMIAAYRNMVPTNFISAVLSAPANVSLPFAPAHTLVLKDLNFLPFAREDFKNRDEDDKLEMTPAGKEIQQAFEVEQMLPALGSFVDHEDWSTFEEELKEWHGNLPEEQVAKFLATHETWSAALAKRKREREREEMKERKELKE